MLAEESVLPHLPAQRFGKRSLTAMACLLATLYGLCTDPLYRELAGRRLGLFNPADAGRLDKNVVFRPPSANDLSNLATIHLLVEHGTWSVARDGPAGPEFQTFFKSGDVARIDGRYYSVRPPMLAVALSGVHWVEVHLLGWRFSAADPRVPGPYAWYCYFSMVWLSAGIATAVMAVQTARSLALLGASRSRCWIAGLLLGVGSLAFPYATVLNHHSVAGALIATATFTLLGGQMRGHTRQPAAFAPRDAIIAGLCAGLAVTVDIAVGGLFLIAAFVWVLCVPALRLRLPWGIAAVLVPGVLHVVLNYQITGDVVPALVRKEYFDYPNTSLDMNTLSGLPHHTTPGEIIPYLAKLVWGPRGLLVYSAPLLFSAIAGTRMARSHGHPARLATVLLLVWALAFLLYLSIFTKVFAGACYGIRWYVPLLPAGYVLLFAGWDRLDRLERLSAALALAVSVPMAWTGAIYGAWQLEHTFPVIGWAAPLPDWTGPLAAWSGDMTWFGWVMMLATGFFAQRAAWSRRQ